MSHPFLRLLVTEPGLLAEHAEAYADLISRDAGAWHNSILSRLITKLVIGGGVFLAVTFAGIAIMLGAVTGSSHWALFVVPAVPAIVAVVAWLLPRHKGGGAFASLRSQLVADAKMLREVH